MLQAKDMCFISLCTGVVLSRSGPDRKSVEGLHVITCDDTEAASAAFEGSPEIFVAGCVRLDNAAIGENDFEVDNIVGGEAALVQIIGEAASQ